jgi:hypothetical protein
MPSVEARGNPALAIGRTIHPSSRANKKGCTGWNRNLGPFRSSLRYMEKRDDVHITNDVLETAAGNMTSGKEIMTLLLDRGDHIVIIGDMVEIAARNPRSGGKIMDLLLNLRGGEVIVTDEVVKAALNRSSGKQILSVLLDHRPDAVVEIAARNPNKYQDNDHGASVQPP